MLLLRYRYFKHWLGHQLADVLMKPLGRTRVDFTCDKLGMYDIYAPT